MSEFDPLRPSAEEIERFNEIKKEQTRGSALLSIGLRLAGLDEEADELGAYFSRVDQATWEDALVAGKSEYDAVLSKARELIAAKQARPSAQEKKTVAHVIDKSGNHYKVFDDGTAEGFGESPYVSRHHKVILETRLAQAREIMRPD